MIDLKVTSWKCVEDLSPYVDSILFNGDEIASLSIRDRKGNGVDLLLVVAGQVDVLYKGETYRDPDEFPEELKERIRNNPGTWDVYSPSGEGNDEEEGDCYVGSNNCFELAFSIVVPEDQEMDGFQDGDAYEPDFSKLTPEELKIKLIRYAKEIYDSYRLSEYGGAL